MLLNFQDLKPGMPVIVKSAHITDTTIKFPRDTREDAVYEAYVLKGARDNTLTLEIVEPMHNKGNLVTYVSIDKVAEGIVVTPDPTRPDRGINFKGYEAKSPDRCRLYDLTTTKPVKAAPSVQTPTTSGFARAVSGIKTFVGNVVSTIKSDFKP